MAINKDKIRLAAQKCLQKGQIDKAIREYQRLVEDDPRDVRTLLKIGDLQTRSGRQQEATETYGKVAAFYAEQGFFLKAVAVYKQILKIDPQIEDVNVKLAELYHQLGLLSDATSQYAQLSQVYEQKGRIEDAVATLRKMVEMDPDNVPGRIKLAEMFAKQNMVEEARDEFRTVAGFLKKQQRVDDYVKVAERIVHLDPTALDTARELANIYVRRGDARRALAKLQICFKAEPRNLDTLSLLAAAFKELGQIQKTVSVFREMGRLYRELNDEDGYLAVMRRLLTVAPDDAEAKKALASGSQQVSRVQVGQRPISPPTEIREVNRRPSDRQSEIEPDTGDEVALTETDVEVETEAPRAESKPAAARQEPAAKADPARSAEAVRRALTEVEVYVKYGLRNKAIEHIERIFTIDPDNQEARAKYKDLLLDSGDRDGAARELWKLARVAHQSAALEQARVYLEELIAIDPLHKEAKALLERLGGLVSPGGSEPDAEEITTGEFEVELDGDVRERQAPPLTYEPSEAAAEIDLDEGIEDTAGPPSFTAAADVETEVVSGESRTSVSKERPSETMGARAQSFVHATEHSQSGASEIGGRSPDPPLDSREVDAAPPAQSAVPDEEVGVEVELDTDAVELDTPEADVELEVEADEIAFEEEGLGQDEAEAEVGAEIVGSEHELDGDLEVEIAPEGEPDGASSTLHASDVDVDDELQSLLAGTASSAPSQRTPSSEAPSSSTEETLAAHEQPQEVLGEPEEPQPDILADEEHVPEILGDSEEPQPELLVDEEHVPEILGEPEEPQPDILVDEEHVPEILGDSEEAQPSLRSDQKKARETIFDTEEPRSPDIIAGEEQAASAQSSDEPDRPKLEVGTATQPELAPERELETEAKRAAAPEQDEAPDLEDEVDEIEFFLQQGLEDEAREALAELLERYPSHPALLELRGRMGDIAAQAAVSDALPAEREEDATTAPVSEPELEPEPEPEPEPLMEPEPEMVTEPVDIGAELADELGEVSDSDLQVAFEDVFSEFKRGVAEQVDDTDYDTHYNLGFAYKEMGLLEDAVQEFELARRSSEKAIGATTMIGLCHLELGNSRAALDNFLQGLNSEHVTAEGAVALRYEIGAAYEAMGRFADAAKFYEKVYAMDQSFRDVKSRLEQTKSMSGGSKEASSDELDALLDETQAEKKARQDKASKISYL